VLTPAFGLLIVWLIAQPLLIENSISGQIPDSAIPDGQNRSLVMSDVRRLADGLDILVAEGGMTRTEVDALRDNFEDVRDRLGSVGVALGSNIEPVVLTSAQDYRGMARTGTTIMWGAVLLAALAGFAVSYAKTHKDFRARNTVEQGILYLLMGAACIAILTTIGILFSLIANTFVFFRLYSIWDFFLGTVWNPSFSGRGGASELGVLPLLWGTFYISLVALLVAVPIGLFAAIICPNMRHQRLGRSPNLCSKCWQGSRQLCTGCSPCLPLGRFWYRSLAKTRLDGCRAVQR